MKDTHEVYPIEIAGVKRDFHVLLLARAADLAARLLAVL